MRVASVMLRKLAYELNNIAALLRYPFYRKNIIHTLEKSMTGLQLELTNICNANCVFCAYQYQERPTGLMSMELYRRLVAEYDEWGGGDLILTPTVGDVLICSDLIERIQYARSKQNIKDIYFTTNMIMLDRFNIVDLVRSGVSMVTVSLAGFDENMYQRVYRSKMYQRVILNIKAFAKQNNADGRPVDLKISLRPDVPVLNLFKGKDFEEISALVDASNIGTSFAFDNWGGKITASNLIGTMRLRRPAIFRRPRISVCAQLYSGVCVFWDGRVGACGCRDVNASELIIGDANVSTLRDIWSGYEIKKLREEFMTDKVPNICKNCTHYTNMSTFLPTES